MMKTDPSNVNFKWSQEVWQLAEKLVSPRPVDREEALDTLVEKGAPRISPLVAYLLATRISDPDLEVRFHMIKALGEMLAGEDSGDIIPDPVLQQLHGFLAHLNKNQILDMLETSDQYLSSEESLLNVFKLCSYAGSVMSGIVNDRKLPISIRQQAIYYCGEIGFLETTSVLQGLVQLVEKRNQKQGRAPLRKKAQDESKLYPFAVAALEKLNREAKRGRKNA